MLCRAVGGQNVRQGQLKHLQYLARLRRRAGSEPTHRGPDEHPRPPGRRARM
ncbi:hypothetical protein [Streptomyces sp. NBC_00057]|uniref:hypothetical protein n=1 Tax=Streptomyces sp. NBC_00057 TaxID=2975634 RepID=UPI00386649E6